MTKTIKNSSEKNEGSTSKQWLLAILANMTLFNYGLQCGWISVSAKLLQSEDSPTGHPLSNTDISWLASGPSIAASVSVSIYTFLADRYGRKPCVILNAVFQLMTWVIKLCPSNTTSLMVARIFSGIAGGGCFITIPLYVKEISQDSIRGTLGMILIVAQNTGIFVMFAIGGYLSYDTVLWLVAAIPLVNILLFLRAPESPSFLIKLGKLEEATKTIAYLRGRTVDDKVVLSEVDAIRSEDEKFRKMPNISYAEIFKHKAWRNGFIFMVLLMTCHGLNGAFSLVNYAASILDRFGVTISPELQSLSIPLFMVFGTLTSMVSVERFGRKPILAIAFIASVFSFSTTAAIFLLQQNSYQVPEWLPIIVIILSVSAYAAAVFPMPSLIMSEMFNFQIRARVMGILVTLAWLFSFIQVFAFGPISENFGDHTIYICFAIVNLAGIFVTLILLPETRGKSVEQIEMELERRLQKKK